jgi:hypothetical protein
MLTQAALSGGVVPTVRRRFAPSQGDHRDAHDDHMLRATRSRIVLAAATGAAVLLAGCSLDVEVGDTTRRVEHERVPADGVATLVVASENGAVDVRGDDVDQIEIESIFDESDHGDGSSEIERDGGRVVVTGDCDDSWRKSCSVGFRITVPRSLDVHVATGNGRVALAALSGDLDVKTDNGRIEGRSIEATRLHARSDNGRVALSFAAAPEQVEVRTDNGRIDIELPTVDSGYDVDAAADNGDVDVAVQTAANSPRRISAVSDNGAVTIAGV